MRLATIDVGSNSVHLLIVEVDEHGQFRPIDREREMVRLGAHGLTTGRLAPDAVRRALAALTHFAELARVHKCERVLATATSAVREADNGESFLRRVKRQTGIDVEILPGPEEARLIALAVNHVRHLGDRRALGIDIGGGSTEFWITESGRNRLLVSNRVGSVRLTESFVKRDPPGKTDVKRLRAAIAGALARTAREVAEVGFDEVVLTSGTAITLAEMAHAARHGDVDPAKLPPPDTEGLELTSEDLGRLAKLVARLPLSERKRVPGLPPERADIIVAGAVLLDTIYETLGIERAQTCDWALREGVLVNFLRTRFEAARTPAPSREDGLELGDIRRRSVLTLARRYDFDPGHAIHTATLAKSIFDQTVSLHGLDREARELLEAAAVLHDIGYAVSHTAHNEHAQYLIMNSEMLGFSSREQSIIGSVARYHQRSRPRKSHPEYGRLRPGDRKIVKRLAAILRIADALDRGSRAAVAGVDADIDARRACFRIRAAADCRLEVWAAEKKARLFERAFEREVVFQLAT